MSTREVSAMIKQGFISDQTLSFSPSRTTSTVSRLYSPSSSPPPSSTQQSHPQFTESTRHCHAQPAHHATLFEMMSQEQIQETNKPIKSQSRIFKLLSDFKNPKGSGSGLSHVELGPGDVRLTVVGKDGFRVCIDVHKRVLAEKSRFFAEKLARKDKENREILHTVEISECDDVEVYVETVVLMYCEDLKKRLLGEDLDRVLTLLKVNAYVLIITACLFFFSLPLSLILNLCV